MIEIEQCLTCNNKFFRRDKGVVCGLTKEKPGFIGKCKDYSGNEELIEARRLHLETLKNTEESESTGGLNGLGVKDPVMAGIILTVLFFILNIILLSYNRISFWLIALLIFGVVVLVKGIITKRKNIAKRKGLKNTLDGEFLDP